jgi:hypothetical protein
MPIPDLFPITMGLVLLLSTGYLLWSWWNGDLRER